MGADYFYAVLRKDEEVLVKTHRSFIALVPALIVTLIFIGVGIGFFFGLDKLFIFIDMKSFSSYFLIFTPIIVSVSFLIKTYLELKYDYLVLTSKRVYGRKGIFNRETFDIMLDKLDTVRVNSTFFGNIFGYGKIEVVSPSISKIVRGNTVNPTFNYITNTVEFRSKILDMLDALRKDDKKD